ncbi:MAG: ABC transporter ATP-binding protein [Proteobacteria bacterium]|nr:MAG: ABC transporter ATP-binding protein [Pseudomonadota bacterium]
MIQNFVSVVNLTTAILLFSLLSLYMTPIEFLIGMFILAIALAPIRRLNKVVGTASAGILTESRKVTHSLLVGLRNQFLLRIYGEVQPVVTSGFEALKRYENHFKQYSIVYCLNGSFPNFIGVLAVAIVTYVSLNYLNTPSSALLAFFYLFFRIAQSASETSAILNEARVYFESFKTLMRFSDRVDQVPQLQEATVDSEKMFELKSLEIDSLGFAWPSGVTVFKNLSTHVKLGDVLLIKGESGSGKSTLLSMIAGLLAPTEGVLRYNGIPIGELQRSQIANQIGYVGPESYIIEGTLRENLLFAHSNASVVTEQEMLESLRQVELDQEFERADVKFDTYFSEFTQLSTGQKQRLAVARALLRKPQLLILDEATANLDSETEARLIRNLRALQQNRITLVVSHRDSFDSIASSQILMGQARSV